MPNEILYLGPFNPEDVVRRRRLPARNPAAYNRMLRLASAIARTGHSVRIVSTGTALSARYTGTLIHPEEEFTINELALSVLSAVGLPLFGFLAEPFILFGWLLSRVVANRPKGLVVYNATLATALAVALAWLFRIPIIYEVEDVPTWTVATGGKSSEKPRLIQNLSWLLAANMQRPLAARVLVPSRRFLDALNLRESEKSTALIVSGCVDVDEHTPRVESYSPNVRPLKVLFAGKLEAEHGYDLLAGALRILISRPALLSRFEFHVCGLPKKGGAVESLPEHPSIHSHGFVSDELYKEILADCDVGLALQKSDGLFRDTRTPSKAYEFLAGGKLLVATNVGDLSDLFPHSAICLNPETPEGLANVLEQIATSPELFVSAAQSGLMLARERFSLEAVGRMLTAIVSPV